MLDPNTSALLAQLGVDPKTVEAVLDAALALTVLTVAAAVPTVWLAKRRGRSTIVWLLFALSLPVLPLIILWWLPAVDSEPKKPEPHFD